MTTDNSGKTYYFNCDRCRVEWINKENVILKYSVSMKFKIIVPY